MKNLLYLSAIFLLVCLIGCKQENPISATNNISYNSLQKSITGIPDPLAVPFSGSFQLSGDFSNSPTTSILELFGDGSVNTLGKCRIFSYTKITSTTQTGSIEITNNRGEKISGTLSGTVQTGTGGILFFSGKYKFINGTGSFSGTTGNGNFSGNFNKNESIGKVILDGVIYLPEVKRI